MSFSAGDYLRITAKMQLLGVIAIENVYWVRIGTWTSGSSTDVMQDMAAWMDAAYQELLGEFSNTLQFVEVAGFNDSTNEPLPSVPWPSMTTGTNSGDVLATGVSALALFHTVKSRVIGRKFIGGLTENALTSALLTSNVMGHMVDYAVAISAGPPAVASTATYFFVIRDKLGAPFVAIRNVINAIPGYQRRRRQGVGV
jgi:hypothetical protein